MTTRWDIIRRLARKRLALQGTPEFVFNELEGAPRELRPDAETQPKPRSHRRGARTVERRCEALGASRPTR